MRSGAAISAPGLRLWADYLYFILRGHAAIEPCPTEEGCAGSLEALTA